MQDELDTMLLSTHPDTVTMACRLPYTIRWVELLTREKCHCIQMGSALPMEEQSVYWSADENPFYYHTSKRYYGQPYHIESG